MPDSDHQVEVQNDSNRSPWGRLPYFYIKCSCGWEQGSTTRKEAREFAAYHQAHPEGRSLTPDPPTRIIDP